MTVKPPARLNVTRLAVTRLVITLGLLGQLGLALAFTDLTQSPYAQAAVYLSGRGIVTGYPDGSFRPETPVTRAELTTVVMRAAGTQSQPGPTGAGGCFGDVPASNWAAPYICAAKAQGVVGGTSDAAFHPGRPISYAEAAKISLLGLAPGFTPFQLGPWHLPYLDFAEAKGLYGDELYTPDTTLTRGVMAKLLYETLALQPGNGVPPLTYPSGHVSEGCGAPPPAAPLTSVVVGGLQRDIITALPDTYRNDRPHALVLAFHGRTSPASEVRDYYELEAAASGTIFVYPSALPRPGEEGFSWFDPDDPATALRDYALFDTLLDTFGTLYCLDRRRVFVVGHSLGAHFANSLACARGHVVRAVGSLGGGVSATDCRGRAAAMILHNPDDQLAPFAAGEHSRDLFLGLNGLLGSPAEPYPTEDVALDCRRYGPPDLAHPVVWCPHGQDYSYGGRYYPHNWPNGTGRAIMDFFQSLP